MKITLHLAIVIKHLALLIWIGGIWFFGVLAAPAIFAQSVQDATGGTAIPGGIVSTILARFSYVEVVCAALVVICLFEIHRQAKSRRLMRLGQLVLATLMLVIVLWYTFLIGPKMHDLRLQIGDMASPTADQQLVGRFNTYHEQYSAMMGLNGIAGLFLFITSVLLAPTAFRDRDRETLRSLEM